MRTVELRRHSFTKKGDARGHGSHLSVDGVHAARGVGASLGQFDAVIASTSPRTLETVIAMGHAADELLEMPSPVETGEVEFHEWRRWEDPFTAFQQRAATSPTLAHYLTGQAERVLATAASIDDCGQLLVVGHGGWLEAVVAGLIDPETAATVGGSFWHLDGVRLALTDDSKATVASVGRFPQPGRLPDTSLPGGGPPASDADAPAGVGPRPRRQTHSNVRDGRRLVWYTENLWAHSSGLPAFEIALDDIKAWTGTAALDEDCWFGGRPATLRDVAKHCARINATSLEHPIILNDDGTLMDGGHRLCRALLERRPTITAVQFTTMPPPDESHDLPAHP